WRNAWFQLQPRVCRRCSFRLRSIEPEEGESIPAGTGDLRRDRAQRLVHVAFVLKPLIEHLHLNDLPIELAPQDRVRIRKPRVAAHRYRSLEKRLRRLDSQVGVVGDLKSPFARSL